jgi:hypothetical protein
LPYKPNREETNWSPEKRHILSNQQKTNWQELDPYDGQEPQEAGYDE